MSPEAGRDFARKMHPVEVAADRAADIDSDLIRRQCRQRGMVRCPPLLVPLASAGRIELRRDY
jgi:hypothetical protein